MSKENFIVVKGRKIDQEKLRKFLEDINIDNIDQFETDEGFWKSPVTGDLFRTKYQLWGQLGAYLRTIDHKDPREPTRAGYVRALRHGIEPTEEQKKAHREYSRNYRKKRRQKLLRDKGIDPADMYQPDEESEDEEETDRSVPIMTWD